MTRAAYTVPFPLLSDADTVAHEAFKVVSVVAADRIDKLKAYGMDLEAWSQRKHHKLAIPSLFLVGTDRRVRWAHAARDYRTRPKLDDLLAALKDVLAETGAP